VLGFSKRFLDGTKSINNKNLIDQTSWKAKILCFKRYHQESKKTTQKMKKNLQVVCLIRDLYMGYIKISYNAIIKRHLNSNDPEQTFLQERHTNDQ
jgi:hypothetical protein